MAAELERAGFDSLWVSDHVVQPWTVGRAARGLLRDRAALAGAAAAAADLPPAHADGLERQRAAPGRSDLRAVLPADAVHAAGAALLGAQDRCRLHRPDAHDHRLLRRRT